MRQIINGACPTAQRLALSVYSLQRLEQEPLYLSVVMLKSDLSTGFVMARHNFVFGFRRWLRGFLYQWACTVGIYHCHKVLPSHRSIIRSNHTLLPSTRVIHKRWTKSHKPIIFRLHCIDKTSSRWLLEYYYGQPPSMLGLSNICFGLYLDGWP